MPAACVACRETHGRTAQVGRRLTPVVDADVDPGLDERAGLVRPRDLPPRKLAADLKAGVANMLAAARRAS
jgi:hypothetical protein